MSDIVCQSVCCRCLPPDNDSPPWFDGCYHFEDGLSICTALKVDKLDLASDVHLLLGHDALGRGLMGVRIIIRLEKGERIINS